MCGDVGLLSRLSDNAPCRRSIGDEVNPDVDATGASKPCVLMRGSCPSLSESTLLPVSKGLLTAESSMLIVGALGRICCAFGGVLWPSGGMEEDIS